MAKTHLFHARIIWSGAAAGPTRSYETYSREYKVEIAGKPILKGSADPAFLGDAKLHNPEDLLVVSLSTCHMLSYLALCARVGLPVMAYEDEAEGTMAIKDRRLRFIEVVLRPKIVIAGGADLAQAKALHATAHDECFIANSVNFPVRHEPSIRADQRAA